MAMILTHDEYLTLSGDAKRYREQRDQLREALEELADEYQYHVDHGKPWQRAQAALKATEDG